jgi:hypothetical protein
MSAVPKWLPGTLYAPGFIVSPTSNAVVTQVQPNNNSFEDGLTHWTATPAGPAGQTSASGAVVFDGALAAFFAGYSGTGPRNSSTVTLTNDYRAPVVPGQVINFSAWFQYTVGPSPNSAFANGSCGIDWYDAGGTFISTTTATSPAPNGTPGYLSQVGGIWEKSSGRGVAPAGAAFASAVIFLNNNTSGSSVYGDMYSWDYTEQGYPPGLVFVATQAAIATSGNSEPVWPVIAGHTVTDGGVTWTAEFASLITWQASSILTSGGSEPAWPTTIGGSVIDNDIIWTASDGRVKDPNCPQSKIVALGAAHVFAGDDDIIPFCAATNPLDWTTKNDAGYLPFGMQTYGNEPVAGLGLYRTNLVAFNALGYQMWQIDPDPANMALIDAEPVSCVYSKSIAPVQNDLVALTQKGIRSLGISGVSGNIQAGQFGKNVDPLVLQSIAGGETPRGMFYPGTGQYWLAFGDTVYVMTSNGNKENSWSQYFFPGPIDAWTIYNGVLFLRSGDLVWEVDENTLYDDYQDSSHFVPFEGVLQWPFIDMGTIGYDKAMEGLDLVIDGTCTVNILYNERDFTQMTPNYAVSGDTLDEVGMLPFPMTAPSYSVMLTFDAGQAWEWQVTNLYIEGTKNT